jgi:hypothetical protein
MSPIPPLAQIQHHVFEHQRRLRLGGGVQQRAEGEQRLQLNGLKASETQSAVVF